MVRTAHPYVHILSMESSVKKNVVVRIHSVIMPMDVTPPQYHQQVGTIMLPWWNLFPFFNDMCIKIPLYVTVDKKQQ